MHIACHAAAQERLKTQHQITPLVILKASLLLKNKIISLSRSKAKHWLLIFLLMLFLDVFVGTCY